MHTVEEVEAHRILNRFLKEIDESSFAQKDATSDGSESAASSIPGLSASDLADAEVTHDILVRECRRDRVRAKGEGMYVSEISS